MNCYESDKLIQPFDLMIAETSEFDLTEGRIYVARSTGYWNLVKIVNDKGVEEEYTTEHFKFYEGQTL